MKPEDFYKTYLQHSQICTDSRKVQPGCLYFSLKGDHFDGNRFAADALAKGSAFAIVDDASVILDHRYILVPDVLRFLQELATYHRERLTIPVIGLTGTNGKTTTKELIHSVLRQKFRTVATTGNLNNHIGVPVTLLSADQNTEILIVEMGANHPGEIAALCDISKPDMGLITNIGKAHLEGFGSYEGVIQTKNELYQWIRKNGGKLFVNEDDPLLKQLTGDYPCLSYGTSDAADITGTASHKEKYLSVIWKLRGTGDTNRVESRLTGDYNLYNILAAIRLGVYFGLNQEMIKTGIESYVPDNMRSQWIDTGRNTLLLDAYNANPSSMALSISNFASLKLPHSTLILGDMFELGAHSASEHAHIIKLTEQFGFEQVIFTGRQFFQFRSGSSYHFFEHVEDLTRYLSEHPIDNGNILIKGSRGMQLEKLVAYL